MDVHDQLNLTHVAGKVYEKTNASAHLVQYRFNIRESSPEGIRKTVEERICETDEFQLSSME